MAAGRTPVLISASTVGYMEVDACCSLPHERGRAGGAGTARSAGARAACGASLAFPIIVRFLRGILFERAVAAVDDHLDFMSCFTRALAPEKRDDLQIIVLGCFS